AHSACRGSAPRRLGTSSVANRVANRLQGGRPAAARGSLTARRSETMADREWILLNPGPANTSRSVREALGMPALCHREPEFFEMMRDCRERLVRLAGCAERFAAVLFTGSGTAAVEAA